MFLWIRNKSVLLIRSFLPPSFSCSFIHIPPNTPFFQALKQKMLLEKLPWWDYPWTCSLTAVDSNTTYEQQSCRKAQSKHLLPVFFSVFFFFCLTECLCLLGISFLKTCHWQWQQTQQSAQSKHPPRCSLHVDGIHRARWASLLLDRSGKHLANPVNYHPSHQER